MTFIWFVVWLIANNVGGHEPLLINPVNVDFGSEPRAQLRDLYVSGLSEPATSTGRRRTSRWTRTTQRGLGPARAADQRRPES